MTFIQIIEYRTSRIDEINDLMDQWSASNPGVTGRSVQVSDRDAAGTYLQIVEFPSYEQAMANSARPETDAFAKAMTALCDGAPTFRNLDVIREDSA
jgi:hypothetical protein